MKRKKIQHEEIVWPMAELDKFVGLVYWVAAQFEIGREKIAKKTGIKFMSVSRALATGELKVTGVDTKKSELKFKVNPTLIERLNKDKTKTRVPKKATPVFNTKRSR